MTLAFFTLSVQAQQPRFGEKKIRKNVEDHITYLASDELEGRGTGTAGEQRAAAYIAEVFEEYGLETAGENGYFQYMTIPTLRMAQPSTTLIINKVVYSLFTDFFPLTPSVNNASALGEMVDLGFGIEDADQNHNDYDSLNVEGKVALINISLPDGNHPHSKFVAWSGLERRIALAKEKGAVAVIFYATNKDERPSGELVKTVKNSGIPVLFINHDVRDKSGTMVMIELEIMLLTSPASNVVAYVDNGAENTVVIGAHHDHLGHGEIGGSLAEKTGEIHNGADDNASGVASLLELARIINKKRWCYRHNNYLFITFTGEEMGLVGSKHYVEHPSKPIDKVNYMVNMDMVGHMDSTEKMVMINGVGTSPVWTKGISNTRYSKKKIASIKTTESGIGASDHTSFYLAGVPAVHFFTGQHEHYHKPSDDVEIVNMDGTAYVTAYIAKYLRKLDKGKAEFTKTKDENQGRRNFKVTLGVMPDYVYDGEGMRIDGVKEGKPADAAGIVKGDIVKTLNGKPISGMRDYMNALSELNKGDKVPVTIERNGEIMTIEVEF